MNCQIECDFEWKIVKTNPMKCPLEYKIKDYTELYSTRELLNDLYIFFVKDNNLVMPSVTDVSYDIQYYYYETTLTQLDQSIKMDLDGDPYGKYEYFNTTSLSEHFDESDPVCGDMKYPITYDGTYYYTVSSSNRLPRGSISICQIPTGLVIKTDISTERSPGIIVNDDHKALQTYVTGSKLYVLDFKQMKLKIYDTNTGASVGEYIPVVETGITKLLGFTFSIDGTKVYFLDAKDRSTKYIITCNISEPSGSCEQVLMADSFNYMRGNIMGMFQHKVDEIVIVSANPDLNLVTYKI